MKQEKTILEWLRQLPDPIRAKAFANTKNDTPFSGYEMVESLDRAIKNAFVWDKSPERYNYWDRIHTSALNGEFDQPAPPAIPWPPESDWDNAPEGTYARSVDRLGICRFFTINKTESGHFSSCEKCGTIDMTGINWETSFEFKPR